MLTILTLPDLGTEHPDRADRADHMTGIMVMVVEGDTKHPS
jgi:hypothetical protein